MVWTLESNWLVTAEPGPRDLIPNGLFGFLPMIGAELTYRKQFGWRLLTYITPGADSTVSLTGVHGPHYPNYQEVYVKYADFQILFQTE